MKGKRRSLFSFFLSLKSFLVLLFSDPCPLPQPLSRICWWEPEWETHSYRYWSSSSSYCLLKKTTIFPDSEYKVCNAKQWSEFLASLDLLVLTGEDEQEAVAGGGRDLLSAGRHVTGLTVLTCLRGEVDLAGELDLSLESDTSSMSAWQEELVDEELSWSHRSCLLYRDDSPLCLWPLEARGLHVQPVEG